MAYFPNGAAGRDYQEAYCVRCKHDMSNDCPIWGAHLMWNGKDGKQDVLDYLIPRDESGENGECLMFDPDPEWKAGLLADRKYLEWRQARKGTDNA